VPPLGQVAKLIILKVISQPEYSCVVLRRRFIFMPGFIVKRIPRIHKVIK